MALRRVSSRRGVTAVELAFGLALLALLVGFSAQLADTGRGAYTTASTKAAGDLRARRAIDRVAEELSLAVASTLLPVPDDLFGTEELVFRQVESIDGTNVTMAPPVRLRLEYDEGERDDGLDNDGDGLVDECRLVLTRDLGGEGEHEIILLRDVNELHEGELENAEDDDGNGLVDERGFCVSLEDGLLTVRITTATPTDGGPPNLRSFETSLMLRN
jgi:hypothetical protein